MRTTLEIDDGVLAAARSLAADKRISLGAAVSELAQRGLRSAGTKLDHGLPVFDVKLARPITPELVAELRDE